MKGNDASAIKGRLRNRGYFDIKIGRKANVTINLSREIKSKDLSIMSRQLSSVLLSDVDISNGILMLEEQTGCIRLRLLLQNVYDRLQEGASLGIAMEDESELPDYLIHMVKIGDESGRLDLVFEQLSEYYEKDANIRNKIRNATTYPAILSVIMIWVIGLLIVQILPLFENILMSMGGSLPKSTTALLNLSSFLLTYSIPLIFFLGVIVLLSLWFKGTAKGKLFFDALSLKIPFVKTLKKRVITARFARSMMILLESGVPIETALLRIADLMENEVIANRLKKAGEDIINGANFTTAIQQTEVFPPLLLRMITVGERTGRLGRMLGDMAETFDKDIDDVLQKLATIVEPALIIVLSTIVGYIMLSVMLPLIQIMSVLG